MLKNARVARDFVNVDETLFRICHRAYEGEKISEILENNEVLKSEEVYNRVD